jgi:hypothetical protein
VADPTEKAASRIRQVADEVAGAAQSLAPGGQGPSWRGTTHAAGYTDAR